MRLGGAPARRLIARRGDDVARHVRGRAARTAASGTSGMSPSEVRCQTKPSPTRRLRPARGVDAVAHDPGPHIAASIAVDLRAVGIHDRPVRPRVWLAKIRALAARVGGFGRDGGRDGPAKSSAARRSTDGTSRSSRAGSCWPRRRAACRASSVDLRAERHADVAADQHAASRGLEHPPDQRRRRRLALGAGDRDDRPVQPARRQLELADHRRRRRPRARWSSASSGGTPGLVTIRSASRKKPGRGAAELQRDADRAQPVLAADRRGLRSVSVTLRAARRRAVRGGHAAAGGADDQHALALDGERRRTARWHGRWRRHRSFSVVRLNSAKRIATIRNRVITFGSLQPMSSKWWCSGAIGRRAAR